MSNFVPSSAMKYNGTMTAHEELYAVNLMNSSDNAVRGLENKCLNGLHNLL